MTSRDPVLLRARFDSRLPSYFMLQVLGLLLVTFVGIPLIPLWMLFGRAIHRRQYENLACELTARSLNVRRGVLLKVQQNIPLDKITDLALYEGPILRHLGLCSLRIETAGGGQATTTGQAMLPGIVDAEGFRDRVLEQRDAVVLDGSLTSLAVRETAARDGGRPTPLPDATVPVLTEIRDTLRRIEDCIADRHP